MKFIIKIKTRHIFLFMNLNILINSWLIKTFIMTDHVYYNLFNNKIQLHRLDEFISAAQNISGWNYILAPIVLAIHLTLITFLLHLLLVVRGKEIPLAALFHIVNVAYLPFILLNYVQFFRLVRFSPYQISEKVLQAAPLSLSNIISEHGWPDYVDHFLNNINLFQMLWLVLLISGLHRKAQTSITCAMSTVLIVWLFIMTLQYITTSFLYQVSSL